MNKHLYVDSIMTPDMQPYKDTMRIDDGTAVCPLSCPCSATPDAFRMADKVPWDKCFGWVQLGTYPFIVIDSPKHGKCLSINNGEAVPTRNPNYTHDGAYYAADVEVHSGYSPTWQGSMSCITVQPDCWQRFIDLFSMAEEGQITIRQGGQNAA